MDILRFINSKDIRSNLKEIDYKFSSLEAAWLVYQCRDATIEEKHKAWNEIIETMPDCRIEARRNTLPQESLHDFLKEYMHIEDRLISDFYDEEHADTFSDDKPYVYQFQYIYKDGSKYDWGTVFSCYDALLETIMEPDEDVEFISCIKMRIDSLSRWPQNIIITPKFEILSIDPGMADDEEVNDVYFGVFSGLWFNFPTPFKQGDILWSPSKLHIYHEGPFAVKTIGLDGIENEKVKENLRINGDNTDMSAGGYCVNEDGTVCYDHMDNYMNLEYYDKELTGSEALLKIISDLLKGKTQKDLFEYSCICVATDKVKESLRIAGLSPENEKEKNHQNVCKYEKIDKSELIPLNSWDDSYARITLADYDWMLYTVEFNFRTEKYGKLNLKFEFSGLQYSTMTISNNDNVTTYRFNSELFAKWITQYLSRHNEQWNPPQAFRGEDLILDFYNDVIENGTIVNGST